MRTSVAFLWLITIGLIISGTVCAATYGGGSGTPVDPYQIGDPNQMNAVGANPSDWGKNFKLMADMDMSVFTGTQYNIIGDSATAFTGTFDGNGHVIRNLTYKTVAALDHVGLFGSIANATIQNLGVENVTLSSGGGSIGGLVGKSYSATLTSCSVTGSITGTGDQVGGLVGENYRGTLTGCYATCSVSGRGNVGGLVGWNFESSLTACYATGSVDGEYTVGGLVGGLVGYNLPGTLTACYAAGPVSGRESVGGLVGYNTSGTVSDCYARGSVSGVRWVGGLVGISFGTLTNCYATGQVKGTVDVGGVLGNNVAGPISGCFWDVQTSALTDGVGNLNPDPDGITGLDTVAMMTPSPFTSAGWDFAGEGTNGTADVWRICENGMAYPRFVWEMSPRGDFACPDGVEMEDLSYLSQRWMATAPDPVGLADVNHDGTVNLDDLAVLVSNWMWNSKSIGSLRVTISPLEAIGDGAQWRRVGTLTWFNSGDTENEIPLGSHTVEFKSVDGWNTPANQDVTINSGETTDAVGIYTPKFPEGLIAHWTLDDNADNATVLDAGDNHLDGTARRNTSLLTMAGKINAALSFDGTTDSIDCGTNAALFPSAWTVSAWVKCADVATPTLLSFGNFRDCIKLQNAGAGKPGIILSANNYRTFDGSAWTTLKDGQWHHVAFTVPGSAQNSIESAQMYLDGVAVTAAVTKSTGPQLAKTQVFLGNTDAAGTQRFSGGMDDVMLFNRALSAAEVDRIIHWVP